MYKIKFGLVFLIGLNIVSLINASYFYSTTRSLSNLEQDLLEKNILVDEDIVRIKRALSLKLFFDNEDQTRLERLLEIRQAQSNSLLAQRQVLYDQWYSSQRS